jgi:hypothetical protein
VVKIISLGSNQKNIQSKTIFTRKSNLKACKDEKEDVQRAVHLPESGWF